VARIREVNLAAAVVQCVNELVRDHILHLPVASDVVLTEHHLSVPSRTWL
jgi:hypothetical protein